MPTRNPVYIELDGGHKARLKCPNCDYALYAYLPTVHYNPMSLDPPEEELDEVLDDLYDRFDLEHLTDEDVISCSGDIDCE